MSGTLQGWASVLSSSVSLTSLTFIHKHAHVDCVLRVSATTFTPLLPKVTTVPLSYLLQLPRPVSSLPPPSHPLLWLPGALLPATNSALGCNKAIKMDGIKSRTSSVPTDPQDSSASPEGKVAGDASYSCTWKLSPTPSLPHSESLLLAGL